MDGASADVRFAAKAMLHESSQLHKSSQARLKELITPALPDAVSDKLKGLTPTPTDRCMSESVMLHKSSE